MMMIPMKSTSRISIRMLQRRLITTRRPFKTHLSKRLLSAGVEGEEAAAVASGSSGLLLKRVFGGLVVVAILYKTRLSNPVYEKIVGTERVALESADVKADLPYFYQYDVKTAAQTMNSRLIAMEGHLATAMSNSTSPETSNRVDEIRTKGYSSGITVNLARGEKFAGAANVNELEKCLETIKNYQANGGTLHEKEYTRVVTLAYHNKISALFKSAQFAANKGDAPSCRASVTEIENYLKIKVETLPANISDKDLANVQAKCHSKHIDNLFGEAQNIRRTGSKRETEVRLKVARTYAKAHNVLFDEEKAQSIVNNH